MTDSLGANGSLNSRRCPEIELPAKFDIGLVATNGVIDGVDQTGDGILKLRIDACFEYATAIGGTGHCRELTGRCIGILHQITNEIGFHNELHQLIAGFAGDCIECIFQIVEISLHVLGAGQVLVVGGVAFAPIWNVVVNKLRNHA